MKRLLSLLVLAGLLLLVAVSPVSASAEEVKTDISDLPFSDEQQVRTANFYEGHIPESENPWTNVVTGSVVFTHVENFKNVNYIQVDNKRGNHPFPAGRTDFYYKRPSDGKICAAFALTSVNRNLLGQETYARTTYFFVDWEVGAKIGAYTSPFFADSQGSQKLETTCLTNSRCSSSNPFPMSDIDGDPAVQADVRWVKSDHFREYGDSTVYVETYSDDRFRVSFETTGLSVLTKIQREFDSPCLSQIYMNDSAGNQVFSDRDLTDKEFFYRASKCAVCKVVMGGNSYIYNLPGGSGPSPENDDFSLSLNRTEAALYESIQATVSPPDLATYDCVIWNQDSYHLHDEIRYRNIDGTWHESQYNRSTESYDHIPSDADPLSQEFSFPDEGQGKISVRVYNLATKQKLADLSEYVQISGESSVYFPLMVKIYTNSGSALMDVHCVIENLDTGETTEKTIQKNYFGEILQLKATDHYKITVSKEGYESRTWGDINSQTTEITAYLPELADPSNPDQIRIFFSVYDLDGQPISGATVQVSGLPVAVTNNQGRVEIQATANTTYQYTVSKSGYVGASGSLTTLDTSFQKLVHLTAGDANPTVPPAPGHTVPKPDMSNEEKAQSIIDFLYDAGPIIAVLAVFATVSGLLKMMSPGGRRR